MGEFSAKLQPCYKSYRLLFIPYNSIKPAWLRKKTAEKHFLGLLITQIYKGYATDCGCFRVCSKNRHNNSQRGKYLTDFSVCCCYDDLQQPNKSHCCERAMQRAHHKDGTAATSLPLLPIPWRPCRNENPACGRKMLNQCILSCPGHAPFPPALLNSLLYFTATMPPQGTLCH